MHSVESPIASSADRLRTRNLGGRWTVRLRLTAMVTAALVAGSIAIYMSYVGLTGSKVAGCGSVGAFSCDHVVNSSWGKVATFPVGLLAMGSYVLMWMCFAAILVSGRRRGRSPLGPRFQRIRDAAWWTIGLLATIATASGIYFVSIQTFVLEHFCTWCLVAHACAAVVLTMYWMHRRIPRLRLAAHVAIAAVAVATLWSLQMYGPQPVKFVIEDSPELATVAELPVGINPSGPSTVAVKGSLESPMDFGSPLDAIGVVDEFASPISTPATPSDVTPAEPNEANADSFPDAADLSSIIGTVDQNQRRLSRWTVLGTQIASSAGFPMADGLTTSMLVPQDGKSKSAGNTDASNTESEASDDDKPASADAVRLVPVSNGTRQLDVRKWPLWGSPDAKYIFVKMFDYTCPHCQKTHAAIREAEKLSGGEVAVVMLPVPLYQGCNPGSQTTETRYAYRCDIAKLAVAAWLADPAKFTDFHNWMMEAERDLPTSRAEAERRFGADVIGEKLAGGIPEQFVQRHVFLYREAQAGSLPKLVFPRTIVTGEITSGQSLMDVVRSKIPTP